MGGEGGVVSLRCRYTETYITHALWLLLLVVFAAEPFAIAIPFPAGWVKNAVYLYIIFEILRIHLCWSCKGQCAHPSKWDTMLLRWPPLLLYPLFGTLISPSWLTGQKTPSYLQLTPCLCFRHVTAVLCEHVWPGDHWGGSLPPLEGRSQWWVSWQREGTFPGE